MADGSHGSTGGASLGGLAFVVALIIAGPRLLRAVLSAIVALLFLAIIVDVVGFLVRHAVVIGASLVGSTAVVVMLMRWRKATVTVGLVALYGFMMLRLFAGAR